LTERKKLEELMERAEILTGIGLLMEGVAALRIPLDFKTPST